MNITDRLAAALRGLNTNVLVLCPDARNEGLGGESLRTLGDEIDDVLAAYDTWMAGIAEAQNAQAAIHDPRFTPPIPAHYPSDQLCADILCTALEGGIGYWAVASGIEYRDDGNYCRYILNDAEGEDDWQHVVDYDAVRRGIAALLAPEGRCTGSTKDDIQAAIRDDDAGTIDICAADAIIQFACFGEIVYG